MRIYYVEVPYLDDQPRLSLKNTYSSNKFEATIGSSSLCKNQKLEAAFVGDCIRHTISKTASDLSAYYSLRL